ncbi:DUF4926 domain-containing protein [Methylobacterium oryzihabitans]|uniref:DUF4926 domain-containing protein n=1 Tax=Methylobacterium oryzihabitans TaxID=2499852 RepID=A0A3S2WC06_9HYPH|nr:DUF4926 domain-containing protein [Methylobacterium oryzihabitans]RVU18805.1 DUF4926 domain-containing protein [Methylobacterium oryzihabitans]
MSLALPYFRITEEVRRLPLDELDVVAVGPGVVDEDEGREIPAGSVGTIVAVYGEGEAFCVEFEEPFHALATVGRDKIIRVEAASSAKAE